MTIFSWRTPVLLFWYPSVTNLAMNHRQPCDYLSFQRSAGVLGKLSCEKKKPGNFWENVAFHKNTFFYLRFSSYVLYHLFKSTFVGGRQSALTIIYFHYDWRLDWTTLVIELEYELFWMALYSTWTGPHCTTFDLTWQSRTTIHSSRKQSAVLEWTGLDWAVTDCTALHLTGLDSTAVGCKGPGLFRIEMHCTVLYLIERDWSGLYWARQNWSGLDRNGLHWMDWARQNWSGLDRNGLHWMDWARQNWSGLDRNGLHWMDCIALHWTALGCTTLKWTGLS